MRSWPLARNHSTNRATTAWWTSTPTSSEQASTASHSFFHGTAGTYFNWRTFSEELTVGSPYLTGTGVWSRRDGETPSSGAIRAGLGATVTETGMAFASQRVRSRGGHGLNPMVTLCLATSTTFYQIVRQWLWPNEWALAGFKLGTLRLRLTSTTASIATSEAQCAQPALQTTPSSSYTMGL